MAEVTLTRILYMEDDPGLSRLVQKSLQRRGYVVDTAADGEEGLRVLGASRYDLLLVDYNMPFCGGIDVIRTLSSRDALLPTVMLTGQGSEEIAVEAIKLGASDYIVKDVELKYLELLPVVIDRVLYQQLLLKERREMAEAARESEERYRRLVELSPDGISVHVDGKFVFMNPAGARLLGASHPDRLVGISALDVVHPDFREIAIKRLKQLETKTDSAQWNEEKFMRLDGAVIDVEVAAVMFSYQGQPAVQTIFRDITQRKLVEQQLKQMALYDALTGLPNRTLFFDRMKQLLELARRNQYVLALLYLDLDRFKTVNDTLGHEAGDLVLNATGQRIRSCTRSSDTVARMGGDEFIGVCGRISAPRDAAFVAEKILEALSAPVDIGGNEYAIGASIGISIYPLDGDDVETLLNKADAAMYRVKETGKGGYAFFSEI